MHPLPALEAKYEVVIIGGRPAGASLAARLGALGLGAVVDRATFPSPPAVPSCPLLYASAMELLDEMGLDERVYAAGSVQVRSLVVELGAWFDSRFDLPVSHGRDYVYSLDRVPFDHALWRHLATFPSVTARAGVSFDDLVRDASGRVVGVDLHVAREEGAAAGEGRTLRVQADFVVGADGRFSAVARKAGAKVVEDHAERTSTVYFADWDGLPPYDDGPDPVVIIHATGRGLDVLHLPLPGGRTTVCTHHRSDRAQVGGDAQGYYDGLLRALPAERRRLEGARQATPLLGVRRIGNRYLDFGGPGWVLVGDAVHHKDPVDGQGIYDALIEAKILAELIVEVRAGTRRFEDALRLYRERVLAATHGMFLASMERLKRELYSEPPEVVIRTLMRWLVTDPEYKRRFIAFLNRDIPAEGWLPPSLMREAALRGAMGDVRALVRRVRGKRQARSLPAAVSAAVGAARL